MLLRTGAIYTLTYSAWKTNFKIYAFILFSNPIVPKIHALNLGAKQLTTVDRAKLIHTIVQLSKAPNANKYSGQLLYRIFTTYCRAQIAKCYRTYFHDKITGVSLLNYGLNKKEDFLEQELSQTFNKFMYDLAKKEFFLRILDLYSGRGVDLSYLREKLAKIQIPVPVSKSPLEQVNTQKTPTSTSTAVNTNKEKPQTFAQPTIKTDKNNNNTPPDELGGIGY